MSERGYIPGTFTTGRDGSWDYPDGDDRGGRIRRLGRRSGVAAVVGCLVLAVVVGGALALADRQADRGPSCPVRQLDGSDADQPLVLSGGPASADRPMVAPPAQPSWLGLPGTEPHDLEAFPPHFGWTYGESLSSTVRFVEADRNLGWPIGVSVDRGGLDTVPGTWTSIEVQGHPAVAGGGVGGSPTVLVDLGDGWRAGVGSTGNDPRYGSDGFDEALAEVRAVADGLVPLGADHWVPIIDQVMQFGGGLGEACYRFGLRPEDGSTFVMDIEPPQVASTLVVAGAPTNAFRLVSAPALDTVPGGSTIVVRGRDGVHLTAQYGGEATQVLVWNEGEAQHRLHFPMSISVEEAVRVADRLVVLDDQTWAEAIFPPSVPADLQLADWSRDGRLPVGAG